MRPLHAQPTTPTSQVRAAFASLNHPATGIHALSTVPAPQLSTCGRGLPDPIAQRAFASLTSLVFPYAKSDAS